PVIEARRKLLVLLFHGVTRGSGKGKSERGISIVVAAPGLFLLRGRRWRSCGGRGRGGWSNGGILRAGWGFVESGGVLEDATGVLGDGLHAGSVGGIGSLDAAVVSAGGFVDVAAEMIEEAAEEQAGIGSEDGIIHGIEVEHAGRAEACGQLGIVAFIFQVELVSGTQGFTSDLPGADGIVTDHDALTGAAKNDVVALSALLPNGMVKIAVDVHVVVLHGADAEKVIERKIVEARDIE